MKTIRTCLCIALLAALAACQDKARSASAPGATPAAPASANAQPETMLGKTVGAAIEKARHELETGNIDLGHGPDIDIGNNGRHFRIGQASNGTKAQLTPQGDLIIEGRNVPVTSEQRALLLDYRRQIVAVAESGMAIGVKGADLAGKAVLDTFAGLMHGDADAAGKRIDAEGKRLEAEAKQICTQLPSMLAAQQRVAAAVPEFRPYANMTREDIDDCGKGDGVSVTSDDGHGARDEVRNEIRDRIRNGIRGSVQAGTQAATAQDSQPPSAATTTR
jgi:hypothetical protein